ncbi:GntR family transcriptional regulator [bacterium]|nr:GntR family transcriptional regulator [bacterium]
MNLIPKKYNFSHEFIFSSKIDLTESLYILNIYTIMKKDANLTISLPPISPAAPGPLYEQIIHGIKREISEGRLLAGQPLPSFRALAEQLMVSLITVKRAYEELEREGIIYRKQGLGTFISENGSTLNREAKKQQAREWMVKAIREAEEAGMRQSEILNLLNEVIGNRKGEE